MLAAALLTVSACSGRNAAETRLREVKSAPFSLTLLHVGDTNYYVIPHDVMLKFNDSIILTKVGGWSLLMAANIDISREPALTGLFKPYAACKGCINSALTFAVMDQDARIATLECDPERDALLVARIAEKYPDRQIIVCFYGGKPFIEAGRMEKVRALLNASPAIPT